MDEGTRGRGGGGERRDVGNGIGDIYFIEGP